MAKKKKYVIGIDIGGTKMLVGLFDRKLKLIATEKSKVQVSEGEKYFFNSLAESIKSLLKEYRVNPKNVAGIGVGCPGIINHHKGLVLSSPNIPFLKNYNFSKKLKKVFKVPVSVGNDVNVGLLGEQRLGAARGYAHVVGIFLGTGVGGALIFNNDIYHGASGGAGEIGHMVMDPHNGILCGCGQRGCLETIIGRLGISSEAAALSVRQQAPHLFEESGGDVSKIKSGTLARAIKDGDKILREMIEHRAKRLGTAMGNLVNVLNPEMIVLGGGVMEAVGDIILPPAENHMRRTAMEALVNKVKVVPAKLGDHAIICGAATLVLEDNEKKD